VVVIPAFCSCAEKEAEFTVTNGVLYY